MRVMETLLEEVNWVHAEEIYQTTLIDLVTQEMEKINTLKVTN